jgi:transcriptional regulator with XRE-family HTH domain
MAPSKDAQEEFGNRLRAGRAYRDIDQIDLRRKMGIGDRALRNYERGGVPATKLGEMRERGMKALNLPEAFFVIDFAELTQMSDAWDQVKRLRRPLADLERLVEEELDQDSPAE